jgi:hypothetical protein
MIRRALLRRFRPVGLGAALLLAWACMPAPARGQGLTALASFNGTNGAAPFAGVTFDANGNLFGTATLGGASNNGTVWAVPEPSSLVLGVIGFALAGAAALLKHRR